MHVPCRDQKRIGVFKFSALQQHLPDDVIQILHSIELRISNHSAALISLGGGGTVITIESSRESVALFPEFL